LADRQIADAMAYIEDHRAEFEAEYQTVLREAEGIRQRLGGTQSRTVRPDRRAAAEA